jgi:hypothetical protein
LFQELSPSFKNLTRIKAKCFFPNVVGSLGNLFFNGNSSFSAS